MARLAAKDYYVHSGVVSDLKVGYAIVTRGELTYEVLRMELQDNGSYIVWLMVINSGTETSIVKNPGESAYYVINYKD